MLPTTYNMAPDLEDLALAGGAFYVDKIERDLNQGRLGFDLVSDPYPTPPVVIRKLTFTNVRNFRELWDEEVDPDAMEQIIGLHQSPEEHGYSYIIRLDQSEMYFDTEDEPLLSDIREPFS